MAALPVTMRSRPQTLLLRCCCFPPSTLTLHGPAGGDEGRQCGPVRAVHSWTLLPAIYWPSWDARIRSWKRTGAAKVAKETPGMMAP